MPIPHFEVGYLIIRKEASSDDKYFGVELKENALAQCRRLTEYWCDQHSEDPDAEQTLEGNQIWNYVATDFSVECREGSVVQAGMNIPEADF